MGILIDLAEAQWLPDTLVRKGIRRLLAQRLKEIAVSDSADATTRGTSIAIETQAANDQHYEVSPAFFETVLGPHRKYSCCWYDREETSLGEAESDMLSRTCSRAALRDGMNILELGCGWGSLTLWMAERFPSSTITAVSNSHAQRATIEKLARERNLTNVTVVTDDINQYRPHDQFDRVVSVEMFEHVRNHTALLERIHDWLKPEGKLFIHVFCHRSHTYDYEDRGDNDWMTRHFFSGGMMPSHHYFDTLPVPFSETRSWVVNGTHYARTCRDWLARLDEHHEILLPLLRDGKNPCSPEIQLQRWRMFFMACEELFAYNQGTEWHVGHYLLSPLSKHAKREENLVEVTSS